MKKRIKILKPVQSYVIGKVYRVAPHFAGKLIGRGQAEAFPNIKKAIVLKQEKAVIETKEEKFIPETKDYPLSISKLKAVIDEITVEELMNIINSDSRTSAVSMARKELLNR